MSESDAACLCRVLRCPLRWRRSFIKPVIDSDVGFERVGLLKAIAIVEEERVLGELWRVGADVGHGDHEGGVLNKHADIAMIGLIIPRAMGDGDVGMSLADDADDFLAVLQ